MSRRLRVNTALLAALSLATSIAFAGDLMFTASFDESPEGPYNDYEAARFLTQATFGPTIPEIQRLRRMGYNAWLDEQLALPFSTHRPYLDWIASLPEDPDPDYGDENNLGNDKRNMAFVERAMHAPDQLRQRLAFALSEILVVSDQGGGLGGEPLALAHYYDLLGQQGLGSYRNLLEQVTLTPVMGRYLSMLGNRKPDGVVNPDENYAREIMQLFSIGLVQLNLDGTPVDGDPMSAGVQPVPTYDQETIRGFAHVFTGWNFNGCDRRGFSYCSPGETGSGWFVPMQTPEGLDWDDTTYLTWHAYQGNKQLLNYADVSLAGGILPSAAAPTYTPPGPVVPGSTTPQQQLTAALNNIANHPNVGPFISKLLIQRFVTSNPEPDYVGRVAAVFNNNGSGVRGDLRAAVRAILMDPDARARPVAGSIQGKLREPLVRLTQVWRAFNAADPVGRYNDWFVRWPGSYLAQTPLHSPTVFNFFLPDYAPVGEVANAGLLAPEFQVQTDSYVTNLSNLLDWIIYSHVGNPDLDPTEYITAKPTLLNFDAERALRTNVPQLVDRLDVLLMSGAMSAHMRSTLINYLNAIPSSDNAGYRRVREAVWLIMVSPEHVIEK